MCRSRFNQFGDLAMSADILRYLSLSLLLTAVAAPLEAQTIDDSIMLRKGVLFAGDVYSHDCWDEYWEGSLKRENGNIGTVTTQSNTLFGNYGVTDRFNVIVTAPYVWTRASQGVLHGMEGFQDITLAAKYSLFQKRQTALGSLRAIAVGYTGIPVTNYTPDFAPLSIGSGSTRISGRFRMNAYSGP